MTAKKHPASEQIEALARLFAEHDGYAQIDWGQFDLSEQEAYRAYAKIVWEFFGPEFA